MRSRSVFWRLRSGPARCSQPGLSWTNWRKTRRPLAFWVRRRKPRRRSVWSVMGSGRLSCPAGSRRAQLGMSPGGDGGHVWTSWTCSAPFGAGLFWVSPPPERNRPPRGSPARGSDSCARGVHPGSRRVPAGTGVSAHWSHTDRPCPRPWRGAGAAWTCF